ncbi:metallophosphoesterase [Spirosoma endophyticum]|uniref:Calcineurin-like phosphoesterase n=1 Tax=Spirosoma endophyticum TaxID=662367 RepID=A0A1I2GKN8_9BACT|nr:metallophosphoesterase [Spirosoma endophyticum]SFF17540.1 Calcineurin-like phosphoesterase [Spirosoma endophyticum]
MITRFFLAVLTGVATMASVYAQKFTIPVFPDTQSEVGSNHAMFNSRIKWVIDHKDSLNIPMVLHVGDVVNFDNYDHFEVASKGFDQFDAHHIPYAITLGNHDTEAVGFNSGSAAPGNVNQNLRKTHKFNAYFPVSRFTHQRGRYEADKSDNAYYTFKVGLTNWLVISLEFCPRMGPINWAGDIIKEYFNYNVIILTHYHLTTKGEIDTRNAGYGDFSPQVVYDRLVKKYANVRFVLSGHVMSSALKVDTGEQGNKVYQILQNYQNEDLGGGYIRLLSFDMDKKTVSASMYSPFYKKTKEDTSRFVLEGVDLIKQGEERALKR